MYMGQKWYALMSGQAGTPPGTLIWRKQPVTWNKKFLVWKPTSTGNE